MKITTSFSCSSHPYRVYLRSEIGQAFVKEDDNVDGDVKGPYKDVVKLRGVSYLEDQPPIKCKECGRNILKHGRLEIHREAEGWLESVMLYLMRLVT